jgi:hypothetical protein
MVRPHEADETVVVDLALPQSLGRIEQRGHRKGEPVPPEKVGAIVRIQRQELDRRTAPGPVDRRQNVRSIPFIFATGYASSLEAPADLSEAPRVEKPLDRRRLLLALSSA